MITDKNKQTNYRRNNNYYNFSSRQRNYRNPFVSYRPFYRFRSYNNNYIPQYSNYNSLPQNPLINMHQLIIQAQIKSEQEKAEKMIAAVQQVMKLYDEHGNPIENKQSETQSQNTSTSEITKSTSSNQSISKNKKQKILQTLAKQLDLESESDSESKHNCSNSTLLTQTQNELKQQKTAMKKQQNEMKKLQQKVFELTQAAKSAAKSTSMSTRKRSNPIHRSPTPPIEVDDSSNEDSRTHITDSKTELTPEQQREYDEKWNKKVEELTQRFSGRGAREALEAACFTVNPKIMCDKDMGVMIRQLATALMH